MAIAAVDGGVWAWGGNGFGELGNDTTISSGTPTPVVGEGGVGRLVGISTVGAGVSFSLAARQSDGVVFAWGQNNIGQLGNGTTTDSAVPVRVKNLTGVVALAGGLGHALAADSQGHVWAWGYNGFGQLGNGTMTDSSTPVEVLGPTGTGFLDHVVAVATGDDHSLALKSDGTVWAWGFGGDGELGNGAFTNSSVPVQVSGLANVIAIGAGSAHSLAVESDNTAWAWGDNFFGELGNGTTTNAGFPVQVVSPDGSGFLANVSQVAGGDGYTIAATSTGGAYSFGANDAGQLGNGTQDYNSHPLPAPVSGIGGSAALSGVAFMTSDGGHSGTIQVDGTETTWGRQVAGPPNGSSTSPQPVVGLFTLAQPGPCFAPTPAPTPTPGSQSGGGSQSTAPSSQCQQSAHPVSCASGEFWHRFVDLAINGRGFGLQLARTYSSTMAPQDSPLGFGWTHSYNMSLSISGDGSATVHEEGGSAITFVPDGSGGFKAPTWVYASLTKNPDGTYSFKRKDMTTFIFDAAGQLTQEQDRNHNATSLSYIGGQLSTVTDAAGRQLQFAYSGNHIVKVTDPIQRSVSFQYDSTGNLIAATDVGGGVTRFTYDANHLLLTMTDPNGGSVTNTYDPAGRVIRQSDAMNRVTTWVYGNGTTVFTDPNGNVTQENFQDGQLTSMTRGFNTAQAATWTLTYDTTTFALSSITDPNGHTTRYTLDSHANILTVTNALSQTSTYTYDALNNPTSVTDPMGQTTHFTYDPNGNVTSISLQVSGSTNAVTTLTYDTSHAGDVLAMTDPNGNAWHFTYDQFGNRVRVVDPLGNASTSTFDEVGRLTSSVSPKGNLTGANPATFTTTYSYDAFNDLLSTTDPLGHTTAYQYDLLQNLIGITDPNGHTTKFAFDADSEPLVTTRGDGSQLKNTYDADGNLVGQVDPLGHLTSYGYDSLRNLVRMTDPLGRTVTIGYDQAGNPTRRTDAMGRVSSFTYDAANELTGIQYSDGMTPNVALAYDRDGRRVQMTDGTGTSTYAYDGVGRLTASTNGAGAKVGYLYDLSGNQTALSYPDGSQVTRTYDADNRLASVTDWLGHRTSFSYDANGNLTGQAYPNGTSAVFGYDPADQLTKITDSGPMGQIAFTEGRDAGGQLTAEQVQGEPPSGPVAYGYDSANRLVSANYGILQLGYQYDAADHVTTVTANTNEGALTSKYAYDAADQLLSATRSIGGRTLQTLQFTYDGNGNRTRQVNQIGSQTTYSYDQANRLTSYAGKAQYVYNGDGLRMSKTVAGTTEPFTWDMSGPLPALIQDGSMRYVTGVNGLPLEQVTSSGTLRYYHQDALGSTRALTNASGQLDSVYLYDPYGNVISFSGSTTPNPFQFSGEYRDAESGLLYLNARYYDPFTAQFVTRDPIAFRTREPYAYVHDSPLNGRDPSGLDSTSLCPCIAGDLAHASIGDLLKDSAKATFEQLLDIAHEADKVRLIKRLAGLAGRFMEGVDYITAVFTAFDEYKDVHDSDLHNAGVATSIYVQVAGPAALTAVGALAGLAITSETGPGAAIGTLIGAFGGALIGGIVAYLMDTISHCVFKEAEAARHRQQQSGP